MSQSNETLSEEALERAGTIATPNQGIEAINKVVSVLFSYKRPAMYKDLALATGLHEMTVSQALSATRDMGLTTSGGKKGLYILTNEGLEYGRLLTADKEDEAKLFLNRLLQNQPAWKQIIVFLKAIRGEARDPLDLALDVERNLNKSWSRQQRNKYRDCYVSILTYSGLIQKEGEKIFSLVDRETPAEPVVPPTVQKTSDFALFQSDDFRFEIRKNSEALAFAKNQFLAWIEYLEKTLVQEKMSENQKSAE